MMGTYVEESINKCIKALLTKDKKLAKAIISDDAIINDLEIKIQDDLIILIATEQPVAGDLRHVITSLKIVTQLERMGDHAVHIAKATLDIADQEYIKPLIDVPKMADIGVKMLHDALSAFSDFDPKLAEDVAQLDDAVDQLRDQVNRELVTYMLQDMKEFNQITSLLFIARWLERFADHVTNICEWIVYDCTGKHVELNL
jgi:phosphate transport system protein